MNSKEKRIAYFDLKGGQHFKADIALLKEKSPDHVWCKKTVFNPDKAAPEILFALLEFATKEEVVANRRKFSKVATPHPRAEQIDALVSLIEKLAKAGTIDELHSEMKSCSEAIGSSTELDEKYGSLVVSVFNESTERIEKYNAQALAEALQELLLADIATLDLDVMLSILTRLGISVTSQDPEVLRTALQDYMLQLEKTDEGTGEEMTGIPAELGQVNELNSEDLKSSETLNSLSPEEIEDLKEQLDQKHEELSELESEKEDLQDQKEELLDQNETLQAENETLQEELELEKKNLPQEPAPPVASSKKKKSSPKSTGKSSKK